MAAASAFGSPGFTSNPSRLSSMRSGTPPTQVAAIGSPASMYSSIASGLPSNQEEDAATSSAASTSGMSERTPSSISRSAIPSSPASASSAGRSGPSPATTTLSRGNSPASSAAARTSTSRPFCARSTATAPTTWSSASSPSSARTFAPSPSGSASIPFGTTLTAAGSMCSTSIILRRSASETARNALLALAMRRRSRKRRTGWP